MKKRMIMFSSGFAFLLITTLGLFLPNDANAYSEDGVFISTNCYFKGSYIGPSNDCGPGAGTCTDNTCWGLYGPTMQ